MIKKVIGNLKMNLRKDEVINYVKKLKTGDFKDIIISPSSIYLNLFSANSIQTCAQNCFYEQKGSYTGELSPDQLKSIDCNMTIIGHSERRNISEDKFLNKRVKAACESGLKVILCIGENLEEYKSEKTKDVLIKQLGEDLSGVDETYYSNITIAYEPLWAIGTGNTITKEILKEISGFLKETIPSEMELLYGGSVNRNNAVSLSETSIDGFLIGSAALDPMHLLEIRELTKVN